MELHYPIIDGHKTCWYEKCRSPLAEGKIIESCETLPYEKGNVVLFCKDKMKPLSNNQYLLDEKDILGIVSN